MTGTGEGSPMTGTGEGSPMTGPGGASPVRGRRPRARRGLVVVAGLATLVLAACAAPAGPTGAARYRLAGSDGGRSDSTGDTLLEDLRARYPVLLRQVFDPDSRVDLDLRAVRRDLEHVPVDRRNFDALNAVAISYFELDQRARLDPGGPAYFDHSFRAAQLLAVPWHAYAEVAAPALRGAILDFFEDAGAGKKHHGSATAARLGPIIASLEAQEGDPGRRARIRALARSLEGAAPE